MDASACVKISVGYQQETKKFKWYKGTFDLDQRVLDDIRWCYHLEPDSKLDFYDEEGDLIVFSASTIPNGSNLILHVSEGSRPVQSYKPSAKNTLKRTTSKDTRLPSFGHASSSTPSASTPTPTSLSYISPASATVASASSIYQQHLQPKKGRRAELSKPVAPSHSPTHTSFAASPSRRHLTFYQRSLEKAEPHEEYEPVMVASRDRGHLPPLQPSPLATSAKPHHHDSLATSLSASLSSPLPSIHGPSAPVPLARPTSLSLGAAAHEETNQASAILNLLNSLYLDPSPDLHSVIRTVNQFGRAIVDGQRCFLYVVDHVRSQLWSVQPDGQQLTLPTVTQGVYPLNRGLPGYAVKMQQPVRVVRNQTFSPSATQSALAALADQKVDDIPEYTAAESEICVPLFWPDRYRGEGLSLRSSDAESDVNGANQRDPLVWGVLQVVGKQAGPSSDQAGFSEQDELALINVGRHIANHLAHLKLASGYVSLETHHNTIISTLKDLPSRARDPRGVSDLMQLAQEMIQADRCSLFLVDHDKRELWANPSDNAADEVRVPMNSGIVGHVASHRQVVNVPNVDQDSRFNMSVDLQTGYRTRNILCAPLLDENGEVLGVTSCINKSVQSQFLSYQAHYHTQPFTTHDASILQAFCGMVSCLIRFQLALAENEKHAKRFELLTSLAEELRPSQAVPSPAVQQKQTRGIIEKMQQLLDSDRCSLFLYDQDSHQLWTAAGGDRKIRFDATSGIAGRVFMTGETLNVQDVYSSPMFYPDVDKSTGYRTQSVLCAPLWTCAMNLSPSSSPSSSPSESKSEPDSTLSVDVSDSSRSKYCFKRIGVLQAVNKRHGLFTPLDVQLINLLSAVSPLLPLSPLFLPPSALEAMSLAPTPGPDSEHEHEVGDHPHWREQLNLFDVFAQPSNSGPGNNNKFKWSSFFDVKLRPGSRLAMADQTSDNQSEQSTAVAMSNAAGRHHFGLITHLFDFEGRDQPDFTPDRYLSLINEEMKQNLLSWDFDALVLSPEQALAHVVYMFQYLEFDKLFRVDMSRMCSLVATVRKSYRSNLYHNFCHALDVMQALFRLITGTRVGQVLPPLVAFAVLVAGLFHDVDHPGVTNKYLMATNSPLAIFYNDNSVLENYHCSAAFLILRQKENDVFANLTPDQYRKVRETMIGTILATDMMKHKSYLERFVNRVDSQQFSSESPDDQQLLAEICIKASDLVHVVREFSVAYKWEELVQAEFFLQGDMEKERGLPVGPLNDREKVKVATSQLGFYQFCGEPLFTGLAKFLPELNDDALKTFYINKQKWSELAEREK